MENNIKIDRDGYGYYIVINDHCVDDKDIINYLGITGEFYLGKGIEFGGKCKFSANLYFYFKMDANDFKEWLEINIDGFLIAKKLVGDL